MLWILLQIAIALGLVVLASVLFMWWAYEMTWRNFWRKGDDG